MGIDLQRRATRAKLTALPVVKTLTWGFWARLALFGGVIYLCGARMDTLDSEKVVCKQEGLESATRYSKTFGQEKRLDEALSNNKL